MQCSALMLTTSKRWQSLRQDHKVNCLLAPVTKTVVFLNITYEIYDTLICNKL